MSKVKCSSENPASCRYHGQVAKIAEIEGRINKAEIFGDAEGFFAAKEELSALQASSHGGKAVDGGVSFAKYNGALETADTFRVQAAARAAKYISNFGSGSGMYHIDQLDGSKGGYYVHFNVDHNFESRGDGAVKTIPVSITPWNQSGRTHYVNVPAYAVRGEQNYGDNDTGDVKKVSFAEYGKAVETSSTFIKEAATRAADYVSKNSKFHISQFDDSQGGYNVRFHKGHNFEGRGWERTVPVTLRPWNLMGRSERVNVPADVVQGL